MIIDISTEKCTLGVRLTLPDPKFILESKKYRVKTLQLT